jgi:glycosyltransferase involved in cell wall biosynthesis
MLKMPKISIITPCFNAENYIEQTILSIIEQDYDNLEYIIIDGGSTDGTINIIKKYEDQITYWASEPDRGQSDAINKGIAKATGDIFNWINADDYLEKGILKLIANEFSDNEIDVLCTNTMLFNESGMIHRNGSDEMNLDLFTLLNSTGLNQMGMYWSMTKIKALNGLNHAFNYSMDLDLFKRYLFTFGSKAISFRNIISGYFRMSEDSKTGSNFSENFHLFEAENNAALIQYVKIIDSRFEASLKLLFPNYKTDLAELPVHSDIPITQVDQWLQDLFYKKIQGYFYANDFKRASSLLQLLPLEHFESLKQKDLRSYKRWSSIRKWIQ